MDDCMLSSENMNFRTPPEFLSLIKPFGRIGLDPSSDTENPCDARYFATEWGTYSDEGVPFSTIKNGLNLDWGDTYGFTFSNPPYGRHLDKWSQKFVLEGAAGCELLTLTPARVDTAWFKRMRSSAKAVCLLSGRIKFWSQVTDAAIGTQWEAQIGEWLPGAWNKKKSCWSNAAAPFPCAVMYWGTRLDVFQGIFDSRGWVIVRG
jgi:hypothetical protein